MGKTALEAPRRSIFMVDPNDVIIVGLDDSHGPTHPLYDDRINLPIDESIVAGMIEFGVREPITILKDGKSILVVDGRQRVRHAREANKRLAKKGLPKIRVPANPPEPGEEARLVALSTLLNEHRQQDDILQKAKRAQRLQELGHTSKQAAQFLRVSEQTIRNYARLLQLDKRVQNAVARGTISASAAAELSDLPRAEQREQLDQLVTDTGTTGKKKPTARQTRKAANEAKSPDGPNSETKLLAPSKRDLRRILERAGDSTKMPFEAGFLFGIRYALGEVNPNDVNSNEAGELYHLFQNESDDAASESASNG